MVRTRVRMLAAVAGIYFVGCALVGCALVGCARRPAGTTVPVAPAQVGGAIRAHLTPGMRVVDLDGGVRVLAPGPEVRATAFVFLGAECTISREYVPTLNALAKRWKSSDVDLIGVVSDLSIHRSALVAFRDQFAVEFPLLLDGTASLAAAWSPHHTPEAIVFDADGKEQYRGAIDDWFAGIGRRKERATQNYLDDALASIVAKKAVARPFVKAVGCTIEPALRSGTPPARLTYARDVAPILSANCVGCHRDGGAGPFSLESYAQAAKYAHTIAEVTHDHAMPPFFANPNYGRFLDVLALSEREIQILGAWADGGAAEGDSADLAPLRPSTTDRKWELGPPDLILRVPIPVKYPASGHDTYWNFVIGTMTEDRAISAIDIQPTARKVIHHIQLYRDPGGVSRRLDGADPRPGFLGSTPRRIVGRGATRITGWNAGRTPQRLPEGVAYRLRKGDDIVINLHYRATGKPEVDQTEVGLYFSHAPNSREMVALALRDVDLEVPAGDRQYRHTRTYSLGHEISLYGINPHMHAIGKEFKASATLPDGREIPLIWIKHWNWRWGPNYGFVEPVLLPVGTKIRVECVFDNSAENPENPNQPPKTMYFGMGIRDEMCTLGIGAVFTRPEEYGAAVRALESPSARRQDPRGNGKVDEDNPDLMDFE